MHERGKSTRNQKLLCELIQEAKVEIEKLDAEIDTAPHKQKVREVCNTDFPDGNGGPNRDRTDDLTDANE